MKIKTQNRPIELQRKIPIIKHPGNNITQNNYPTNSENKNSTGNQQVFNRLKLIYLIHYNFFIKFYYFNINEFIN